MAKVLLVNPVYPTTYWSFKYALKFIGKKALIPPLGLLTIAAMLPEGYEPKVIDMNTAPLTDDDILGSDLVFLTAMIVQKDSFSEVVRRCNRLHTPVVAGGPYPTSLYESIPGVDHFILGEAEAILPRFISDHAAGRARRVYSCLERPDISGTPVPRFDLVDMDEYNTISLQFSRGCPFHCEFCDIVHLFGNTVRTKTTQQFIREMNAAYATGFRGGLFIVDDNFIGNRKKVKDLLKVIIPWQKEKGYPFQIITEASINLAGDEKLLDLMVEAGFTTVFIGLETPATEALAETGKTQNLKGNQESNIKKIQNKGLEVSGGFIIGFDTDPRDIFDRQFRFIQDLAVPTAMIGLLMALPNTKLYQRLKEEGRIYSESAGNNTHGVSLNFKPVMGEDTIYKGYAEVLSKVYNPRHYFRRCYTLLTRFPKERKTHACREGEKLTPVKMRAFWKSLAIQGFSGYGISFFSFLFKTLFLSPKLIPYAVLLAIQGHHFFLITKEVLRTNVIKPAFAKERKSGTLGIERRFTVPESYSRTYGFNSEKG